MRSGRYYIRPRKTLLGSYRRGLDLFGLQERGEFARYRRDDEAAIARAWFVTGKVLRGAMDRFAAEESIDARGDDADEVRASRTTR